MFFLESLKGRNLLEIIKQIQNILSHQKSIKKAYLFGSTIRGQRNSDSDIDLSIELSDWFTFFEIAHTKIIMEEQFGIRIDMSVLEILPKFLQNFIYTERVLIFEKKEKNPRYVLNQHFIGLFQSLANITAALDSSKIIDSGNFSTNEKFLLLSEAKRGIANFRYIADEFLNHHETLHIIFREIESKMESSDIEYLWHEMQNVLINNIQQIHHDLQVLLEKRIDQNDNIEWFTICLYFIPSSAGDFFSQCLYPFINEATQKEIIESYFFVQPEEYNPDGLTFRVKRLILAVKTNLQKYLTNVVIGLSEASIKYKLIENNYDKKLNRYTNFEQVCHDMYIEKFEDKRLMNIFENYSYYSSQFALTFLRLLPQEQTDKFISISMQQHICLLYHVYHDRNAVKNFCEELYQRLLKVIAYSFGLSAKEEQYQNALQITKEKIEKNYHTQAETVNLLVNDLLISLESQSIAEDTWIFQWSNFTQNMYSEYDKKNIPHLDFKNLLTECIILSNLQLGLTHYDAVSVLYLIFRSLN